jgi:hypothetical protein
MPRPRLEPLPRTKCLIQRHRLTADRNTTTRPDGTRITTYTCAHPDCPRYQTPVATREITT